MERRMIMPERGLRLDGSALLRLGALGGAPRRPRAAPRFLAILAVAVSALAAERSLSSPKAEENPMKLKLSVLASAAIASPAFATDRLVPQQYPTIQAAVDASISGDRVVISPGTYTSPIVIAGKSLFIEGVRDATGQRPILDGLAQHRIMAINDSAVTVSDLEFRQGRALTLPRRDGAGILRDGTGTLTVQRCHFESCIASTSSTAQGGGGAIYSWEDAVTAIDCTFRGNQAFRGSSVFGVHRLVRCVLESGVDTGGGVFSTAVGQSIEGCTLVNTVVYMVRADLRMSGTWRCGLSDPFFEISGQLVDLGGNQSAAQCDCDQNTVLDYLQLSNPSADRNNDGVIDACQCIADITGNGAVDGVDLAAVLGAWGSSGDGKPGADIDGDGIVAGTDLAIVLGSWGACPAP
jgi:hypothetical protein